MIAVVMTYFRRWDQLWNTLKSLNNYKDIQVVVVNDDPDNLIHLGNLTVINISEKSWTNPEPAYNLGIRKALEFDPESIILQNAECYHMGDIVGYVRKHLTDDNYISFGCYSQGKEDSLPPKILNNKGACSDGESAWYNHPLYRPVGYDFCSAIRTKNLVKLNGYDERFSRGQGYGDNYLLDRVKMFLKVEITAEPYVIHQWHEHYPVDPQLTARNLMLYSELVTVPEIRATHLITPDL